VQEIAAASAPDRTEPPTSVDVTVDLGDGRRLTGVVPDVRGSRLVRVHYSRLSAKHRLAAWIDLLALSAAFPDQSWTAASYGWFKRYSRQGAASSLLGPVDDLAPAFLRQLVDVRDRGLREPLPLFTTASADWATAVRKGDEGFDKAGYSWRGSDRVPGERDDPAHVRVYGAGVDLARVVGQPRDDEDWNDEPTRAGRYALHVWTPLLSHEKGRNL
jgi:exodeoxyribonuclease V gamma subunit